MKVRYVRLKTESEQKQYIYVREKRIQLLCFDLPPKEQYQMKCKSLIKGSCKCTPAYLMLKLSSDDWVILYHIPQK